MSKRFAFINLCFSGLNVGFVLGTHNALTPFNGGVAVISFGTFLYCLHCD